MISRVVLIGFSGTGKSTVGRLTADRLGWHLLDMDAEIERREGTSIPDMFETRGEAAFRAVERAVFLEGLDRQHVVIATGGGAVCTEDIWSSLRDDPTTLVVRFDAPPEEILRRLDAHRELVPAGQTTRRPMLDAEDPLGRIVQLKADREAFYARAHVTIAVASREPELTAEDISELVGLGSSEPSEVALDLPNVHSRILVGKGTRALVPDLLADRWPKSRHVWIAADAGAHAHHSAWFDALQDSSDRATDVHVVASGESSKSLAGLSGLYDWMIGGGAERGDVAIAAGGGVTGDLMGFAASSVLRGIGLMQVPTTLLSMVDSSVGGKTGINHPGGKNLIGAFYQPSLVVVDPEFLSSLPPRELRSGFAEIIKHGVIQASTPGGANSFLLEVLERNANALLRLEEPLTSWVIRQNIALKASVVKEDEKESRLRAILNFGHTIGHGIEAAGYSLLHGEAVAVGMLAAMTIGVEKGLVGEEDRTRLDRLIRAYGLPVRADVDIAAVRQNMVHDKKKAGGAQQWVLPLRQGGVEIRTDVSESDIMAGLNAVVGR
jgi:shikimate kinase/3-dehydroquinate synthase